MTMGSGIRNMSGALSEPLIREPQRAGEHCRVLHINSGNLYGGVESILTTLARLRDLCPDMDPHYAICHEGRLSEELRQAGVPVYNLGKVRISRPWTVWRARRRLHEVLDREGFELVICHMPWSLAVFGPTVNAAGKRLAFWAHAYHQGTGWLERLARRARPDVAIANSRYTEGGLENLFPGTPRAVIYPPVAMTTHGHHESRASLRAQLGIGQNTVVVIQVSRMESWKGHRLLLEALSRLGKARDWACWMVGGPQKPDEQLYFEGLQKVCEELGLTERVRFLGQRADVDALLSAADIFCQPNLQPEPFGIVFIEALWSGKPVVATAIGGALEIVDDFCGILSQPGDSEALAHILGQLIDSPELRTKLGRAGAARAEQISGPAKQMKLLEELIQPVRCN